MWRAPLAGLASLAMIATMGVAASTANAAGSDLNHTAKGATADATTVWNNESYAEAINRVAGNDLGDSLANEAWQVKDTDGAYLLTAPVTADVTVEAAAADKDVTFDLDAASAQVIDGKAYSGSVTVKVPEGSTVGEYHSVADAADTLGGHHHVVLTWTIKEGTTILKDDQTLEQVLAYPVAGMTGITVTPKNVVEANRVVFNAPSDWADKAHLTGAYVDAAGNGASLTLEVPAGTAVASPSFVYDTESDSSFSAVTEWQSAAGNLAAQGGSFTPDRDVTFTAKLANSKSYIVSFDTDGADQTIDPVLVEAGDRISEPTVELTKKGYEFNGWEISGSYKAETGAVKNDIVVSWSGVTVTGNVQLKVNWRKLSYKIQVTFDYGDYDGAPADVTKDYNADEYIDEPETPTRAGYVFDGWYVNDGRTKFNFATKMAGEANANKNFTLNAHWHRAYTNEAQNALNYVQSKDYSNGTIGVNAGNDDDSKYFTDASWTEFIAQYKKAYQTYKTAYGQTASGEIDSETAADVVNTLQAAWKDLRFTSATADTVLDGKDTKADATAKVVYRLNREAGLHHLLSADENEVLSLSNANFGPGNWTRDDTTFRVVNNLVFVNGKDDKEGYELSHPEWVEGTDENAASNKADDGRNNTPFSPLLKQVTRLYNAQLQEHMYTSDANEIAVLTAGDWTEDSNLASFYVPALYTTKTKVVRLYNPSTHLHLYTSDTNEVNVLTTKGGWTLDGDAASFYAL